MSFFTIAANANRGLTEQAPKDLGGGKLASPEKIEESNVLNEEVKTSVKETPSLANEQIDPRNFKLKRTGFALKEIKLKPQPQKSEERQPSVGEIKTDKNKTFSLEPQNSVASPQDQSETLKPQAESAKLIEKALSLESSEEKEEAINAYILSEDPRYKKLWEFFDEQSGERRTRNSVENDVKKAFEEKYPEEFDIYKELEIIDIQLETIEIVSKDIDPDAIQNIKKFKEELLEEYNHFMVRKAEIIEERFSEHS